MIKRVGPFGGRIPKIDERYLPDNIATVAKNCDIEKGILRPIKDIVYEADMSGMRVVDSTGVYVVQELATGNITAFADYSGTVAGTVKATSTGHGLVTGDDVDHDTVSGDFEGIYSITKIDDDNYYFTATWTATTTGTWKTFNYIITSQLNYIFNLGGSWLRFDDLVNVVRSFLGGTTNRIYYTGDGYPKQTNLALATSGHSSTWPTEFYKLGIVAPAAALTAAVNASGTTAAIQTVSYVYTYVTDWGEESAPSPPSNTLSLAIGESCDLTGFVDPDDTITNVVSVRVYKLNSSDTLADYELIPTLTVNGSPVSGDIPVADAETYGANDDTDLVDLTEAIITEDFDPPPSDLAGLIMYVNGSLAGVSGKELCLSEPWYPYAWPEEYRLGFNGTYVALGHHRETIFVLTNSVPWVASGADVSSMGIKPLKKEWPCKSATGVVSTEVGVVFPSAEGMALLAVAREDVITENLFTKDDWGDLDLENMLSFYHDGKVFCFFKNSSTGFWFNPKNPQFIIDVELANGWEFIGGHVYEDDLYVIVNNTISYLIYKWEAATTYMAATWKKAFFTRKKTNFQRGMVIADGACTFKYHADDVLKHTETIAAGGAVFTLPSGFLANKHELEVITASGTSVQVEWMGIAHSVKELTDGYEENNNS